jgi:hypothetical protein
MEAIELDLDPADDELVAAFAGIVRELALERLDLTDPLTAIEADRRLAARVPDGAVEFAPAHLLTPPMWSVHRDTPGGYVPASAGATVEESLESSERLGQVRPSEADPEVVAGVVQLQAG